MRSLAEQSASTGRGRGTCRRGALGNASRRHVLCGPAQSAPLDCHQGDVPPCAGRLLVRPHHHDRVRLLGSDFGPTPPTSHIFEPKKAAPVVAADRLSVRPPSSPPRTYLEANRRTTSLGVDIAHVNGTYE